MTKMFTMELGKVEGNPGLVISPIPADLTCNLIDDALNSERIGGGTTYGDTQLMVGLEPADGRTVLHAAALIARVFDSYPGAYLDIDSRVADVDRPPTPV